jgi:hypothetical protein
MARTHLKIRIFVPPVRTGIFDRVKEDPSFQPPRLHRDLRDAYCCISRIGNEDPTGEIFCIWCPLEDHLPVPTITFRFTASMVMSSLRTAPSVKARQVFWRGFG